ncbi:hypothetical protein OE766_03575 [Pararhizobium sp. YC-54]|uniref:hypothetical protein n=1 Tax=Pararhizobium sp. YC-54 TaxID=2986920 RepID=UPI0021F718F9|nr:hypothetical protein [Pararhizobium sp. YC-54]MCV9997317.1 hypothetical protein [Pararhizobium sp. YC-54]
MTCLVPLLEDQIELLRKQVKDAAYSHDALFSEVAALRAENATLRERLEPQPPAMTGNEPAEGVSAED